MSEPTSILAGDEHNRLLLQRVHPESWANPKPRARYHLVVIGGGTAGLVSAAGAAGLGASVALVERNLLGGDCLNYGCVPSKAILRAAHAAASVRNAHSFGVDGTANAVADFPRVMERMRKLRAELSPSDSAERFRSLGVDVFFGAAQFVGRDRVTVGDQVLTFRRAIIATGTRPRIPLIPGLNDTGYLTNESIFSLTELAPRLAILGAGPIGCEMAQAFARLGSQVTLIANGERILPRDDEAASAIVAAGLRRDGVEICLKSHVLSAQPGMLTLEQMGQGRQLAFDAILVATGRTPNVENLNLEAAGVRADPTSGVIVDDRLKTTNGRIFAAGDVCSRFKFTHAADAYARIAVQNALFYGRARASGLVVPWCTYTDPEIAHVGLGEIEAKGQGIAIETFVQEFRHVDGAVIDGDSDGFVKIHVRKGTDRIVGATIVGSHAGEMIGMVSLAMTSKLGVRTLAKTVFPYPTHTEALKKIGDAYNRTRLTPLVRWFFERWFGLFN